MLRRVVPVPRVVRVVLAAAVAAATATPALAGPPLLCHPFKIGAARSLPWQGTVSWRDAQPDYPLSRLVADTTALLQPDTPVVVRMETMRRAAIYASRDPQVAASLLASLMGRVRAAERAGHPDALAGLDAGYYVEALREIAGLAEMAEFRERAPALRALVEGTDGYTLAARSLAARPGDPAMEFAAALIAVNRHSDAYASHAAKARAGAGRDPLLASNIEAVR